MDISGTIYGQLKDLIAIVTRFMRPYAGKVLSVDDAERRGRVQCAVEELGWLSQAEAPWCEPLYRGGSLCVPAVGDYVKVEFLAGNGARPVWDGLVGEVSGQGPEEHDGPKKRVLYSCGGKSVVHDEADNSLKIVGFGDVTLDADGKATISASAVELNGNSKAFVTHAELDTAIQTFIAALNLHVHGVVSVGSPTSPPASPMSLNIASAATTTVKTGG